MVASVTHALGLAGRRIIVTGASQGIGLAITTSLIQAGADVVGVSRNASGATAARKACAKMETPGNLSWVVADAQCVDELRACVATAAGGGVIHGLVNNAGIAELEPVLGLTQDKWDAVMATNVRAPAFLTQFVAAHMIEAEVTDGSIVNVSSTASTGALADHAAYCCSKAALDMLTKNCAVELGMHGIRVNAVNPTVTLTPMGEKAWGDPEVAAPMLHKVPLQRFARPTDVASAVAFLLDGTRAAYLSGVCLPVDGGFLAPGTILPPHLRPHPSP